jgi:hypothetical protein
MGFDSDMVLQRAPAKAAVYGQMVAATPGADASVAVTVSMANGSSYTVDAHIAPSKTTYSMPGWGCSMGKCHLGWIGNAGVANYTTTWKAYLKAAPAGGEYTITAVCTGCNVGPGLSSSSIRRVTFGDVYFCSGQSVSPLIFKLIININLINDYFLEHGAAQHAQLLGQAPANADSRW